jgi:cell wall-associated NlpC family hydrolase
VGATVPDFRVLFLRGVGGYAAALGVKQDDAVGVSGGSLTSSDVTGYIAARNGEQGTIIKRADRQRGNIYDAAGKTGGETDWVVDLSGLFQGKTADETRPVNVAVRYLMRALP